ncbi:YjbF family lipoprotein [Aliidiomarina sanyensis]|uniref:YjbF family lipoprotein n=1 Tax=Aliidiomarina sanyensis TaxID=1249555 RepID=A0A432WAY4_9GAMM|nr:YjbF family lipoprotein [Aliidiomarina sanyensis]RUO27860.1 hypothetical protein CWE11_11170 [Aliidiomarina sanyensis]
MKLLRAAFSQRVMKVAVVPLLLTGLLVGCSGVHQDIRETFRYVFTSGEDFELTPEQIADFPYTGIYVRRGNGPQNFVVLGFIEQLSAQGQTVSQLHWVTSDEITLVTEHGRLVRTVGLARAEQQPVLGSIDLHATSNRSADPLRCLVTAPQGCPTAWEREVDYTTSSQSKSSRVSSQFETVANVMVELPTRMVETTHIIERGRFHATGERFVNEFWAEPDGHVVKSKQTFMPGEAPLAITQVKWIGREEQE